MSNNNDDNDHVGDRDFEASLLRAARGYRPPASAKRRVLAGLGLATGTVTATSKAALLLGAAKSVVATKTGLIILSSLAVVTVAGGLYWQSHPRDGTAPMASAGLVATPAPLTTVSAPAEARITALPESTPDGDEDKDEVLRGPNTKSTTMPGVRTTASTAPPEHGRDASSDTLGEELALLDRARTAQRDKRYDDAFAALAEHERRFPAGKLTPQAEIMRIESLAAAGRKAEAKRRAERFIAAHPESILAGRARDVVTSLDQATPGAP